MTPFRATSYAVMAALLATAVLGCQRQPAYEDVRPPTGQIDPRGRGLQAKDIVAATDQLAMDLMAHPRISQSPEQLTIVLMSVENRTTDPRFDYDIFIERLRGNISRHGQGRVQLVENRDRLRDMQRRELEQERDDFGQGPAARRPGPAGIQPQYGLYGTIMEMPGRGTSYYLASFTLADMTTREQVWNDQYEVVARR